MSCSSRNILSDNNILDAVYIMEALSDEFPAYADRAKIEGLKEEKAYKKQVKLRSAAYRKELARREIYFNAFAIFNFSTPLRPDTIYTPQWWKREVHQLKKYEESKNPETSMMGSRLLNMIEVQCAESLWNYVYMDQKDKALFTLELWLQVTPDKLWANWNAAKIYAVYDNRSAALKYIEKIILSGETKMAWFSETPEFDSLRSDPYFSELMELVGK